MTRQLDGWNRWGMVVGSHEMRKERSEDDSSPKESTRDREFQPAAETRKMNHCGRRFYTTCITIPTAAPKVIAEIRNTIIEEISQEQKRVDRDM